MCSLRLVRAEERDTTKRKRVMNEASLRNLTGLILILTPVAFNVFFTLLTVTFEYPDILREPTDRILRQFDAGSGGLVAIWYGFMLTAVLFVPVDGPGTQGPSAPGHALHDGCNCLRGCRRGGIVPRPKPVAVSGPLSGGHLPRSGVE